MGVIHRLRNRKRIMRNIRSRRRRINKRKRVREWLGEEKSNENKNKKKGGRILRKSRRESRLE